MNIVDRPMKILLVEDNDGDIRLTKEALREGSRLAYNINVVRDGVEALAFLRREGSYSSAVRPDIILLDLNLPRKNGKEVLAEIKQDDQLKRIPVVVLTTSKAEQDIVESYNLYANCYVTKPLNLEQFFEAVKSIEDFWLRVANLPLS
ncbi:MAG: response regulator [Chamaesiphon sp.]